MMQISRKVAFSIVFALAAYGARAVEWVNVDESAWLGGVKITSPEKLSGRVVLVDEWGYRCPPCKALLPRMQELWKNFGLPSGKPFIVLGSHRQQRNEAAIKALIEKHDLTYPIYQGAGIAKGEPDNGGAIPFLYVLDHRGKVIYKGRDDRLALEAVINALAKVGKNPSLTEDVHIVKHKHLEERLQLGKPIAQIVATLEREADGKNAELADEAGKILQAIERAKHETREEIAFLTDHDPVAAVKLIMAVKTTWPEMYEEEYASSMPKRVAKAKAFKAAKKSNGARK
ncbi:MAG: TlpA family protein disulfide reductase [Kiritimatiellae bacterium]|nr:TlpA family protein disulfide reductase [Kiritimatiellia bacterium]